jgi:large subunit ribosomal protein L10
MAITRAKKEEIAEKAQDIVKSSKSVAFVNFHGLSVEEANELRNKLREEGVRYFVLKKTIAKRILENAGIEGELPELEGELALAGAEDPIAPARGVYDFAKTHKEKLFLVGGIFEGRFMNKEEMAEIASIPPVEILYGKVMNVINSPISSVVIALGAIAEQKERTV